MPLVPPNLQCFSIEGQGGPSPAPPAGGGRKYRRYLRHSRSEWSAACILPRAGQRGSIAGAGTGGTRSVQAAATSRPHWRAATRVSRRRTLLAAKTPEAALAASVPPVGPSSPTTVGGGRTNSDRMGRIAAHNGPNSRPRGGKPAALWRRLTEG